ncbi:3-dehydroquinate synthase [Fusobacterium russii]|uniref:3-dehydroquinate synthase n=1 Tax=Fusobacterium russii TaxID=854 RepID=UPI0004778A23
MKKISNDIYIGSEILNFLNEFTINFDKILIFSNETIADLYFDKIKKTLVEKDKIFYFTVKDGEKYKNIETILPVYDFMLEHNFSRKSLIISLGGGVVCDMGGYIAASYMRGIEFIQVPTSLLAQVDASVGGKVAINHPRCKNMIGAFKQAYKVIIDVEFLKTLPLKEFKSGMGEVLKHLFLIKDKSYTDFIIKNVEKIKNYESEALLNMVEQSVLIKKGYVDIDPLEKAERAFLNLGHTYAHALESFYNYEGISHGEAVSKGLIFDLEISYIRGNIDIVFLEKAKNLFKIFNIDAEPIYIPENKIIKLMNKDKKNSFNKIITIGISQDKSLSKIELTRDEILKVMDKYKNNYLKASIDIGTNSCRLLVAEIKKDNERIILKRIVHRDLEIVKLGEDVNKNKYLKDSAIERTLKALKKFKETLDEFSISNKDTVCFATSATRDSSNRNYFIEKVFKETALEINCITGKQEAYINFKGVSSAFESNRNILVFDIGGGSTEFTLGNKQGIEKSISLDIGSVRISEKFFSKNGYNDYSIENIARANEWLSLELKKLSTFLDYDFDLIGVAGTVSTQVSVKKEMEEYDSDKIHLSYLTKSDIEQNIKLFLKNIPLNLDIKGLDSKRRDVIIGGSIILKTILEYFNKDKFQVSELDNLVGAILGGFND